jgi:ribosomal protein S18 acetylase RimI-like enzyme
MPYIIRQLQLDKNDLDAVAEIDNQCFGNTKQGTLSKEAIKQRLGNGECWGVVDADNPNQIMAVTMVFPAGDRLHIFSLATHPAYQGQGHAKRLMAHIEDLNQASFKCPQLTLWVQPEETQARLLGFYKSLGYQESGRDEEGVVFMRKKTEFSPKELPQPIATPQKKVEENNSPASFPSNNPPLLPLVVKFVLGFLISQIMGFLILGPLVASGFAAFFAILAAAPYLAAIIVGIGLAFVAIAAGVMIAHHYYGGGGATPPQAMLPEDVKDTTKKDTSTVFIGPHDPAVALHSSNPVNHQQSKTPSITEQATIPTLIT